MIHFGLIPRREFAGGRGLDACVTRVTARRVTMLTTRGVRALLVFTPRLSETFLPLYLRF
jgi:hypothetical protein